MVVVCEFSNRSVTELIIQRRAEGYFKSSAVG